MPPVPKPDPKPKHPKGLRRKTQMKRGGRITPKKRASSEFARIYGSRARVRWIKEQGCVACGWLSPWLWEATKGTCENAHTHHEGMSRKGHFTTIVPLCPKHHRRFDQHLRPFDKASWRNAIIRAAELTEVAWQVHSGGADARGV